MKPLIVYHSGGRWFGSQVEYKRSGSGHYREIAGVEVPQSRAEIERFAKTYDYAIEWRGPIPAVDPPAASPTP